MKATAVSGRQRDGYVNMLFQCVKKTQTAEVFQAWAAPGTNGPLLKQTLTRSTIRLFHCTHFSYETHTSSEGKVTGGN